MAIGTGNKPLGVLGIAAKRCHNTLIRVAQVELNELSPLARNKIALVSRVAFPPGCEPRVGYAPTARCTQILTGGKCQVVGA